jgi:hypothetical protein
MTKSARAEQTINRPADEVWARIGKFDDITWVPNTGTCTVVDGVRTITMKGMDGFELKQRLVEQNDETRTLRYELAKEFDLSVVFGPGSTVNTVTGILHVEPQGDDASHITYDVETEDFMVEGTRNEYQGALDNAKKLLEG